VAEAPAGDNDSPWLGVIVELAFGDVRAQVRVLLSEVWITEAAPTDGQARSYAASAEYVEDRRAPSGGGRRRNHCQAGPVNP
jgi:hypothetical protein